MRFVSPRSNVTHIQAITMGSVGSTENGAQQKMANTLVACLVADAASMGTHWIYDSEKLKEVLSGSEESPEFHEPPSCPFYSTEEFPGHYMNGMPSPYAEEALALIEYINKCHGNFESGEGFARSLFEWAEAYSGRKNHATKLFEENVQQLKKEGQTSWYPDCGADDAQANAFWKTIVTMTRYVGAKEYQEKVEEAIRTHQNHDEAVEYGLSLAKMLNDVIVNGVDVKTAISNGAVGELSQQAIDKALSSAIASKEEASMDQVANFLLEYADELAQDGDNPAYRSFKPKTCGFPQSFVVGLKFCLDAEVVATSGDKDFNKFTYAIRRNILAGGDNCGRVPVIAGLLAASGAKHPRKWEDKTSTVSIVKKYIDEADKGRRNSQKD